jgi:hypothetical protein
MCTYKTQIRAALVADDGFAADLGAIPPGMAWYEKPLPPCPDCGGDVVWFEAGHVPGTRKCVGKPTRQDAKGPVYNPDGGCGSLFSVRTENGHVILRRERFH